MKRFLLPTLHTPLLYVTIIALSFSLTSCGQQAIADEATQDMIDDAVVDAQMECDEDDSLVTTSDFKECVDAKIEGMLE